MIPRRADMVVTRWGGARFMGRRFPCSIGRGGISGTKQEGDGVTPPAGIWHLLGGGGFRADRRLPPHAPFLVRAIGPADIWSDDPPTDPAYNQGLRAHAHPPFSHERLRMGGPPLYDVFLVSDQNFPDATPGKGSALFVHQWRKPRHPTAGCIAFAPNDLDWILSHWTPPQSRIFVR